MYSIEPWSEPIIKSKLCDSEFFKFFVYLFTLFSAGSFTYAREGDVVLVTGASRGIGLAIVNLLSHNGYIVYAGVRQYTSSLPEVARQIQLDVTDQNSIDLAIETILNQEGRIDVVVNNAGTLVYGSVENITIEEATRLFDVNFFGAMRVMQAVLPIMRQQRKGRMIQMSSRSGFRPLPSLSVYAASKFALEGLSETTAALCKPWNIHISLIEPGPVSTELDFYSPYGSRVLDSLDPYYPIFEKAGLLHAVDPLSQTAEEIALIVREAIEATNPLFRYQTTDQIRSQASQRLVDRTGMTSLEEWDEILFSHQ